MDLFKLLFQLDLRNLNEIPEVECRRMGNTLQMGRRQLLSLATSCNQFKTDLFVLEIASLVPAFEIAMRWASSR